MKTKNLFGIIYLLLIVGCASSKITSSWKANDVIPKKYNKILVLGLIRTADRRLKENIEHHIVEDLKAAGQNAVSSVQEYGPKAFDKMDEEIAMSKIKNNGIDAVITIVLLDKEKERKYVPGDIHFYSPFSYYHNNFWGYHTAIFNRIYEPGYYITTTRYFWESNLYEMNTQKLVYSVQTQSFNPEDSEKLGHEYGLLIVNDMVRQMILKK